MQFSATQVTVHMQYKAPIAIHMPVLSKRSGYTLKHCIWVINDKPRLPTQCGQIFRELWCMTDTRQSRFSWGIFGYRGNAAVTLSLDKVPGFWGHKVGWGVV